MDHKRIIKDSVKNNLGATALECTPVGNGAVGSVWRVSCDKYLETLAVKISPHRDLLQREYEMLKFLRENTKSLVPKAYWFDSKDGTGIMAMEYINGISGDSEEIKNHADRGKLSESIINNLLLIQEAHNDKFGPYDAPVYDSWQEYYMGFARDIYEFAKKKYSENSLDVKVIKAVETSYKILDKVFSGEKIVPTLIHGDYWMANLIIDRETWNLLSVVDPFNIMWADPEYELFALVAGFGEELSLYELYKSKVKVSAYCDVKIRIYALYSELLWYKKLGSIDHSFVGMLSDKMIYEMRKHNI